MKADGWEEMIGRLQCLCNLVSFGESTSTSLVLYEVATRITSERIMIQAFVLSVNYIYMCKLYTMVYIMNYVFTLSDARQIPRQLGHIPVLLSRSRPVWILVIGSRDLQTRDRVVPTSICSCSCSCVSSLMTTVPFSSWSQVDDSLLAGVEKIEDRTTRQTAST